MSPQEVFDTVVNHLRQQGSKSVKVDEHGKPVMEYGTLVCMYRSPDGKKCAVGIMISDEEYHPGMEHHSVEWVLTQCLPFQERMAQHHRLLTVLQTIHDQVEVRYWENEFIGVARQWGLQYIPPVPKS